MDKILDEDDTFRMLRRTDFLVLRNIILDMNHNDYSRFRSIWNTPADLAVFFGQHGWTFKEYCDMHEIYFPQ